ncbi:hypothetical protein ES703_112470 [subsurface metagenome]
MEKIALRERDLAGELIVKKILKDKSIHTTRDDIKSEMWIYSEGIYIPQGRTFVKEYCRRILGYAYSGQFANKVIEKIETDTYIEQEKFFKEKYPNQLPVQNGILDITI